MTTAEAFKKLLNAPELQGSIPPGTIRQWQKRTRDGVKIHLNTMEDALIKAGAKKIPEKWTFKKRGQELTYTK